MFACGEKVHGLRGGQRGVVSRYGCGRRGREEERRKENREERWLRNLRRPVTEGTNGLDAL